MSSHILLEGLKVVPEGQTHLKDPGVFWHLPSGSPKVVEQSLGSILHSSTSLQLLPE